ncbi:MAG: N-acetyltransferase family protein [Hyphomonadaceae bacterium]
MPDERLELREGDKRAFFEAPFAAYGPQSHYVSPMWADIDRYFDAAKNPLFSAGNPFRIFTAHRNGRPIGRIGAHMHRASNARHNLNRAYFGFFDVADDAEAADALLNAALAFARREGASELAGNFNLTAMQQIGVMTDGFENPPYTDMIYSPPHIAAHLARAGFEPFFPVTTWEIDLSKVNPDVMRTPNAREALADPTYEWMPIDRRHFAARLEDARAALNDGFDRNPMFVPLTKEEYEFHAKEMMWILDPRISACVRAEGAAAGVIICIPDLNPFMKRLKGQYGLTAPFEFLRHRLTRKRAVFIYYSVAAAHQGKGLNSAMLYRVLENLKAAGYEKLGVTWIADVNGASLRQMEKLGARRLHRLHLFRKVIA